MATKMGIPGLVVLSTVDFDGGTKIYRADGSVETVRETRAPLPALAKPIEQWVADAHALTPACNVGAGAGAHWTAHTLACRTLMWHLRAGKPAPVATSSKKADKVRDALVDLIGRASEAGRGAALAGQRYAVEAGTYEGGIESILILHFGLSENDLKAIAGRKR